MCDRLTIYPAALSGRIRVIPSKSQSHRALLCAAAAAGGSVLRHLGASEDVRATLSGLTALGAVKARCEPGAMEIDGGGRIKSGGAPTEVFCGESGSTLRFLIPFALAAGGHFLFTGAGKLMERPLGPYLDLFERQGIRYTQTEKGLEVEGKLRAGTFRLPGNISSQFISGLLMALPLLGEASAIELTTPLESAGYVEMTREVMAAFGVETRRRGDDLLVGGQRYAPRDFTVEGDYSHAAFFLVAGALGGGVEVEGLSPHTSQGDSAILDILRDCGITVEWGEGDLLSVRPGRPAPFSRDVSQIPDLAPVLSVLACGAEGVSRLEGAGRLRFKESDRLAAMALELGNLGASVAEGPDSLEIRGTGGLRGGECSAHRDHRVAMSIAVSAAISEGEIGLEGWRSVAKSAPDFWEEYAALGGKADGRHMG